MVYLIKNNLSKFNSKSEKLLTKGFKNSLDVYSLFLQTVAKEHGAKIACEQTPQNLYYLHEILEFFPDAKVINLVRDQRDVLLSKKQMEKTVFRC